MTQRPHGEHPTLGVCDCDDCQAWDEAERHEKTTDTADRDEFVTLFATWLLDSGYAAVTTDAERMAWDFVCGAWNGNADLAEWAAAYDDANKATE